MDTKIIGIILLICAGLVFQYSYDGFMDSFFSPEVKLKSTIENDINNSLSQESVENKSNIHHVKFVYRSTDALNFLKKHPPQFQINKEGKIWLEVEVLDLQDNETPGFITQISVFDLKTKNKISEFGQTYYYKDFDKDFKLKITGVSPTPETNSTSEKQNSEKTSKEITSDSKNPSKSEVKN
ncbi:MAG: hypothetical protein JSU04_12820 [Bdellovibrionales bacterium]|nr:hypothetical protein [Bdellovibrionales bacterium]